MIGRSLCTALGAVLLSLLIVGCGGGDDEPAALPTSGAEVCDQLDRAERFRYVFDFAIESPRQENVPADVTPTEPGYAVSPTAEDFRFAQKYDGAFVQPDRADYVISLPDEPEQSTARGIRIGQNQWFFVGESWQIVPDPPPFVFSPPAVCDALVSQLDLTGKDAGLEKVGDTEARRISFESVPLGATSQLFGPASDMARLLTSYDVDLWISEKESRLVKVEATSNATYPFGRELTGRFALEVGSYNDGDIEIEPPQIG
jgi:hypothetical protein